MFHQYPGRLRYLIALRVGGSGTLWVGSVPFRADGLPGRTDWEVVAVVCKGEVESKRGHPSVGWQAALSGHGSAAMSTEQLETRNHSGALWRLLSRPR